MKNYFLTFCLALSCFASAQLTNSGFENWSSVSGSPYPIGWGTSQFGVDSTSDAYEGSKALVVWTWYNYAPGYVSSGSSMAGFGDFSGSGVPCTQKPISLTGFYKFDTTNVDNLDSVLAVVFLKKYNIASHQRDTVALGLTLLPGASTYTPFTVAINDLAPGINPDSLVVVFSSQRRVWSNVNTSNTCRMPLMDCAYFYLDALQINTSTDIIVLEKLFEASVYPNPSNDFICFNYKMIPDESIDVIYIYDQNGKCCFNSKINSINNKVKVNHLKEGLYYYLIRTENNTILKQGKFVVSK